MGRDVYPPTLTPLFHLSLISDYINGSLQQVPMWPTICKHTAHNAPSNYYIPM